MAGDLMVFEGANEAIVEVRGRAVMIDADVRALAPLEACSRSGMTSGGESRSTRSFWASPRQMFEAAR